MEHPQSSAPVSAVAEIDIAADAPEVWKVIADIASWPTWNPAVREAVFLAELEVGARFRFATELGRISCRLTEVDAPTVFAWKGRVLTVGQHQSWHIERRPEGARVTTSAAMTGLGAHIFRGRLQSRLKNDLDALVRLLKLEAEARSAEEREEAERAAEAERRASADE